MSDELKAELPKGIQSKKLPDGRTRFWIDDGNYLMTKNLAPNEIHSFVLALIKDAPEVELPKDKRIFIVPEGKDSILIGINSKGFKLKTETAKIFALALLQQALKMEPK